MKLYPIHGQQIGKYGDSRYKDIAPCERGVENTKPCARGEPSQELFSLVYPAFLCSCPGRVSFSPFSGQNYNVSGEYRGNKVHPSF
jgi:hypothetical protein